MGQKMDGAVVVLLSGGQDSTTCLAWAANRWKEVHAISFDYGQRHRAELEAAEAVVDLFDYTPRALKSYTVLPLPLDRPGLSKTALTADQEIAASGGLEDAQAPGGLPTTFVPGRNLIFLAFAAARAVAVGARAIVIGVCQTDYSGYPDCRESFVAAADNALYEALPSSVRVRLVAPLLHLSKAQTVELAVQEDALEALALTVTCYRGQRPGCGTCPACELRAKGFREAGVEDPAHG